MSQRAFLADLDAGLHAAFAASGMADAGLYLPKDAAPGAVPTACRVYVDRDIQTLGETQQYKAGRVEVAYVLADVQPRKHGQLVVDGDTYFNDDEISNDGSLSRWVVRRG
ncbi:hypothetical protein [Luteimonas notoginsengisoli]|uniref:Head-to-tail stopper n=1 Tax=Luteimonas notoginsengisoli TaxID=1578200 RepID=A0ABV7UQ51_9GAMM